MSKERLPICVDCGEEIQPTFENSDECPAQCDVCRREL